MRTFRAMVAAACLGLAAVCVAQDRPEAPPPKDRLVVKARLRRPIAAPANVPAACAFTDESMLPLPGESRCDGTSLECVIVAPNIDAPGRIEIHAASGDAPVVVFRDSLRGELDLGEILFGDDAPLLVAGRVLTAEKKPIFGADVVVRMRRRGGRATLSYFTAITSVTGAFAIRGDLRGDVDLAVETSGHWLSVRQVDFTRGAADVTLVAAATASMRGTVEVPADLPFTDLVVVMTGPPGGTRDAEVRDAAWARRGGTDDRLEFPASPAFEVDRLLPGAYDVRVRFREASRPLAQLPEIVLGDATTELPCIRVTAQVHHVAASVAGPDGTPTTGAKLWARDKGDRGKFRPIALDANSMADVAYVADEVELAARADGTDFAILTTSKAQATLALRPGRRAKLAVDLPDGAPRAADGVELLVALTWIAAADVPAGAVDAARDGTDPRAREEFEIPLPAAGAAVATVDVPGWYQVGFRVRRKNLSRFTTTRFCGHALIAGRETKTERLDMSADEMRTMLQEAQAR